MLFVALSIREGEVPVERDVGTRKLERCCNSEGFVYRHTHTHTVQRIHNYMRRLCFIHVKRVCVLYVSFEIKAVLTVLLSLLSILQFHVSLRISMSLFTKKKRKSPIGIFIWDCVESTVRFGDSCHFSNVVSPSP